MEVNIVSDRENKPLKRREIEFSVDQEGGTPKRDELTREVCKKLNLNPDSTVVVKVDQGFGRKRSTGIAHSYASREALEKTEPKHLLARISKKAGKGEQKAEEKKEAKAEGKEGKAEEM